MVKRYRQKIIEVDAVQWDGKNLDEIRELTDGGARTYNGCLFVKTTNGEVNANVSDYILKSGTEHFPIIRITDAETFEKIYEEV